MQSSDVTFSHARKELQNKTDAITKAYIRLLVFSQQSILT